jgi:hypothetical protein
MTFARRLRAYIIGLILGIVLVSLIFRERLHVLTDWLPGNRVLMELRSNPLAVTPKALCEMRCMELDTATLREAMLRGSVQFGESSTRTSPRIYAVDLRVGDALCRYYLSPSDSLTLLTRVEQPLRPKTPCRCD